MGLDKKFLGLPLLVWQLVFFFIPFVFLLIISFWQLKDYQLYPTLTFENYKYVIFSEIVRESFKLSIKIVLVSATITTLLAYPFVYGLVFYVNRKYSFTILCLSVIPLVTSYILRSYSWRIILSDNGFLNWTLLKLGLVSSALPLQYTSTSTIIGLVCYYFPIPVLFLYMSFSYFNKDIILAAKDLGG